MTKTFLPVSNQHLVGHDEPQHFTEMAEVQPKTVERVVDLAGQRELLYFTDQTEIPLVLDANENII